MYRKDRHHQFSLSDFNQPIGLIMNPDNRWVKKAELIPWDEIEDRYGRLLERSSWRDFVLSGSYMNSSNTCTQTRCIRYRTGL